MCALFSCELDVDDRATIIISFSKHYIYPHVASFVYIYVCVLGVSECAFLLRDFLGSSGPWPHTRYATSNSHVFVLDVEAALSSAGPPRCFPISKEELFSLNFFSLQDLALNFFV